jgi:hypothetical protein
MYVAFFSNALRTYRFQTFNASKPPTENPGTVMATKSPIERSENGIKIG